MEIDIVKHDYAQRPTWMGHAPTEPAAYSLARPITVHHVQRKVRSVLGTWVRFFRSDRNEG